MYAVRSGQPLAETPVSRKATLKAGSAYMTSSTANAKPEASPKRLTTASEVEIEANHRATRQMAKEMVEGLRKLARQKASRRNPNQAA